MSRRTIRQARKLKGHAAFELNGEVLIEDIVYFATKLPLYTKIKILNTQDFIMNIILYEGNADCYCPYCDDNSIFKYTPDSIYSNMLNDHKLKIIKCREAGVTEPDFIGITNNFHIRLTCVRNTAHSILALFTPTEKGDVVHKYGQDPSIFDFSNYQIHEYKKYLSHNNFKELQKASASSAHGYGIAAYSYLRRVYEKVIYNKYEKHSHEIEYDGEAFAGLRMDEKIQTLKKFLPSFLVENKHIYRILSKGIHVLEEDECLTHFPALFKSLILILDEDKKQKEKEELIADTRKDLNIITQKLNNGSQT